MSLRPSTQSIGSTVGKRLFGTSNASIIQRKIQRMDQDKLKASLREHGVKSLDARSMAKLLTGESRGGTMKQVRAATNALKDLGASQERASTGQILYESSKRATQDETYKATGSLRPNAAQFGGVNASIASRVAEQRFQREGAEPERPLEQARSIREVRDMLRQLGIQERKIAKKLDDPSGPLTSPFGDQA